MVDPKTPIMVRRIVAKGALDRAFDEIDELATIISRWRNEASPLTGDKADYRKIGRCLEKALKEIETALERLET